MNIKHIVISGNIGVGKTTLSDKVSKKFNWDLQLEEVDDNPYLDDFYKSMSEWSFHLQIFFLNSRFNQIQKISESNKIVIQDRSIYEDYEVFTKTLHDSGILKQREFNNYERLYNTILKYIDQPDLLIYLRNTNINNIVKNIRKRKRDFEKKIDKNYLIKLNNYYEKWIKNHPKEKLLTIDLSENDFIEDPKFLKKIYSMIEKKINELT
ncbi:MAG: deoxynucleoside kinase [Cytophagia bacterium]|nr:deoxynucleoside kinase [Cytophagia bacterium]|tara:strand:+ start:1474 stop:2100 length:627 start_codon:yes stop_codon:yes gene_type:complete